MVFQHSRPLHRQTVLENIILGLLPDRLHAISFPLAATDARARAIAERVGLAGVLDRRPSTLPFADSAQNGDRQGDRPRSAGGADRRAVRRPDGARDRVVRDADRRNARRRAGGPDRRPQREEHLRAGRPHLRHACRRAHRRGHGRGGDGERDRAQGLSRRRARDGGAAGDRVSATRRRRFSRSRT